MATKPAQLYDIDFYAWTQEQAAALREHFRGDNRLDVEHLAEEVEDLGRFRTACRRELRREHHDALAEARLFEP